MDVEEDGSSEEEGDLSKRTFNFNKVIPLDFNHIVITSILNARYIFVNSQLGN